MDLLLRIGALAERTALSTHVLRAWEDGYQLLTPQRSASGYRLYSAEDEERVRQMMLREQGVAAAEAAQRVLNAALDRAEPAELKDLLDDLLGAFTVYDEAAVHAIIDEAVVGHPLARVIDSLFFPFLRRLGEAWERGRVTVVQEHYASTLVLAGTAPTQEMAARHGAVLLVLDPERAAEMLAERRAATPVTAS